MVGGARPLVAVVAVAIVAVVAVVAAVIAAIAVVALAVVAFAVVAAVIAIAVAVVALPVVAAVVAVADAEVKDGVEVVLAIPEEVVLEVGCVGAPMGGFSMGPIESSGNCNTGALGIILTAVGQVP